MGCGVFGFGGYYSPWIGLLMMGIRMFIFVWLVITISKFIKNYKYNSVHNESLRILDEKFVNGDINEDEYKLKKSIILDKK